MSLAHTAKSSRSCGAAIGIFLKPVASPQRMRAEAGPRQRFCHYNPEGTAQADNSPCERRRPLVLEGQVTDFPVETTLFDRLLVGAVHPTSLLRAGGGWLLLTTPPAAANGVKRGLARLSSPSADHTGDAR